MNSYTAKSGWVHPTLIIDRIDSSFYKKEDIENLRRLFNSELPLKTLLDISNKITDGPHDGYTFVDNGVLFLRSQNIKNAGFDLSDKKFIEPEFHNKYRKSWLEQGDLLITRIGQYFGNAAVVSKDYVGCNINHAIAKVQLKKEVDPYYVCAYINSPTGNKLYRRLGKSFTSPRVNLADFSEFLVPLPARKIQTYIGNKVRKAEELREEAKRLKEEVNNLIYSILKIEEFNQKNISQSRYNWVRVDQLEARLDATYYKEIYLKVYSHLKELGYPLVKIKKIGQINKGTYYDEKYSLKSSKEYSFVRISDIGELEINYDEVVNISLNAFQSLKKYHINQGDILFAITGATIGKVCINHLGKLSVTSGDIGYLRVNHPEVSPYYVLMYFKTKFGQLQLEQGITGATNRHLAVNFIAEIEIPLIPKEIQETIENNIVKAINNTYLSKKLIEEAKQDVEDLIESKFDESKISEGV